MGSQLKQSNHAPTEGRDGSGLPAPDDVGSLAYEEPRTAVAPPVFMTVDEPAETTREVDALNLMVQVERAFAKPKMQVPPPPTSARLPTSQTGSQVSEAGVEMAHAVPPSAGPAVQPSSAPSPRTTHPSSRRRPRLPSFLADHGDKSAVHHENMHGQMQGRT